MTAALALGLAAPAEDKPGGKPEEAPSWLVLVAEMKPIAELDSWKPCPEGAFAKPAEEARAALKKKLPEVEKRVTAEAVRDLSGWAKKEMTKYEKVPSFDKVTWAPVRADDKQERLLLEGTVDTLPTHSPLVKRWLKTYVVYDVKNKEVSKVVVTIRGQVEE
jgi:hypothetical protein